jgi:hypothetical protein
MARHEAVGLIVVNWAERTVTSLFATLKASGCHRASNQTKAFRERDIVSSGDNADIRSLLATT